MKVAVVLFNLGGPDSLESVENFLFNLFYDPAIIRAPNPMRYCIAKLISSKRAPKTQDIYRQIGNKSPLLEQTQQQTEALENMLNQQEDHHYKIFIHMRYWHPMAEETAANVKQYHPDKIILLPLYPQFSTTTTASSVKSWKDAARKAGISAETTTIGCYPTAPDFIKAHVDMLVKTIAPLSYEQPIRILFSAHGLPKKVIAAGDPYQSQVEKTVQHVMPELLEQLRRMEWKGDLDYAICYQSRVGPLEWIGPSTEEEIKRAGKDDRTIVLTPIAFVSEHSETLVELDMEYRHLAEQAGVRHYLRVPALGTHAAFINALASLCQTAIHAKDKTIINGTRERICQKKYTECICRP